MEETRIYVAVAATIQVPSDWYIHNGEKKPKISSPPKTIVQPSGRQIAQACHVVSMLRMRIDESKIPADGKFRSVIDVVPVSKLFYPVTTIILQARDSAEMGHVFRLLNRKRLNPVIFSDNNPEYGPGDWPTAVAVFATKKQVDGILDYLPLWGTK